MRPNDATRPGSRPVGRSRLDAARTLTRLAIGCFAAVISLAAACDDDATDNVAPDGGDAAASDASDAADVAADPADASADSDAGATDAADLESDGTDAAQDLPPDDGSADVNPDAPDEDIDAAGDAPADAADLAPDGTADADAGDGGSSWQGLPPFDWSFCPEAETYEGDEDWDWDLEATSDAVYCRMFEDVQWTCCEVFEPIIPFTQPERWNDRFELRIVEGTYPVPAPEQAGGIRMPVCLQFADGRQAVTDMAVMGDVASNSFPEGRRVSIEQPLALDDETWKATIVAFGEGADPLLLDGSQVFFGGSFLEGPGIEFGYGVQSCTHEGARRDLQTSLVHARGTLDLFVRIGDSPASTEPGVFYRAEGTLDGVPFEQADRWHLWYEVQHHHFTQYYLVLFDAPMGDVCGLEILNAVQYEEDLVPEDLLLYEVACEGLAPPEFPLGDTIEVTDYDVVNLADE